MSEALATQNDLGAVVAKVILKGDLSELSDIDRVKYVGALCDSIGLNPLTKPFDLIELPIKNSNLKRVVVYANKNCAQQLIAKHQISILDADIQDSGDYITVKIHLINPAGRQGFNIGVVYAKGLMGEDRANAIMKAYTKAERRAVLSFCGLGVLDESEIDSIPGARLLSQGEITLKERKPSNLHSWTCGYDLALQVTQKCAELKKAGYAPDQIKGFLPEGVESRKDLTPEQAQAYIKTMNEKLEEKQ